MFVSKGQIFIFIACIAFGAISGILFSITCCVKKKINNKYLSVVIDITAFFLVSFFYVFYSYKLNFGNIRLYMPTGVLLGIFLYIKSFNYILAKISDKIYNKINKRKR